MTIQEAIRSGKRCRRKSDSFGPNFGKLRQDNSNDRIVFEYVVCKLTGNTTSMPIIMNDILADDWEIEREPREIWATFDGSDLVACYQGELTARNTTRSMLGSMNGKYDVIKFREVIE